MIKEFVLLNPKTAKYSIGIGGKAEIDWIDVLSAIPKENPDFMSLFMDRATPHERQRIINFMSRKVEEAAIKKGLKPRKTVNNPDATLKQMCRALAKMALFQFEHPKPNAKEYTIVERLMAGGLQNISNTTKWDEVWGVYDSGLLDWLRSYYSISQSEARRRMNDIRS